VKKMLVTVLTIFLVTSIILLNLGYFSTVYTSAVNTFSIFNASIPYTLIQQYEGDNLIKKKEAEAELKKICLNHLEYTNWRDYLEYIDLKIYKGNILPNNSKELIVALNLSKDLAVACIFKDDGESYNFAQRIENLLPIDTIKFIKIPDKEYEFLIPYQVADERLGAYYYENFLEVYMYNNDFFEEKLKETIFYEEIYRSIWVDDSAPEKEWTKNTIKNNIIFIDKNSKLYIDVSGAKNKYIAYGDNTIPKSSDFKVSDSNSYSYKYFWNKEHEKFSRKEDIVTFNNIPVFIIGDSETDNKNLCGFSKNKYKLMTSSDRILYIDKELIDEKK